MWRGANVWEGTRTPLALGSSLRLLHLSCPQNSTFSNAVVGGTGIFKGASGTTNVTVVVQGNTWQYDVQLIDQPSC